MKHNNVGAALAGRGVALVCVLFLGAKGEISYNSRQQRRFLMKCRTPQTGCIDLLTTGGGGGVTTTTLDSLGTGQVGGCRVHI